MSLIGFCGHSKTFHILSQSFSYSEQREAICHPIMLFLTGFFNPYSMIIKSVSDCRLSNVCYVISISTYPLGIQKLELSQKFPFVKFVKRQPFPMIIACKYRTNHSVLISANNMRHNNTCFLGKFLSHPIYKVDSIIYFLYPKFQDSKWPDNGKGWLETRRKVRSPCSSYLNVHQMDIWFDQS